MLACRVCQSIHLIAAIDGLNSTSAVNRLVFVQRSLSSLPQVERTDTRFLASSMSPRVPRLASLSSISHFHPGLALTSIPVILVV